MPDKKYYVYIPGTTEPAVLSPEEYSAKKDKLFEKYKDANVVEMQGYGKDEEVGNSDFFVFIPGTTQPAQINAKDFAAKKDKLYEAYPDVQVSRIRPIDYYGDRLTEQQNRINTLENERRGLPAEPQVGAGLNQANADAVIAAQQAYQPTRERRQAIDTELDQLYKEREANPAWNRYWKQFNEGIGADGERIKESTAKYDKEHNITYNTYRGGTVPSLVASNATPEEQRQGKAFMGAQLLLDEAQKVANAPSKYADKGDMAWWNEFWKGVAEGSTDAISQVNLVKAGLTDVPLLEAVNKIQRTETMGKDTNLRELVDSGRIDNLDYLGPGEKELLKAFMKKAEAETMRAGTITNAYQAGQGAVQSLGFMADFALFGGAGNAAAKAATGKMAEAAGRRALPKLGVETLAGGIKALAMTPLMPSSYVNFLDNMAQMDGAGRIDLSGKAALKAAGDVLVETVSETIGAKPLELVGLPLQKVNFGNWGKALRHSPIAGALKQAGYNGFFEEMFEEWTGALMRQVTHIDDDAMKQFWDKDNIMVTAASFAPMSLFGLATSSAQFGLSAKNLRNRREALDGIIDNINDKNAQQIVRDALENAQDLGTPEEFGHSMADVYRKMVDAGAHAKDAYKAVLGYTEAASRYKVMTGVMDEQKDVERAQRLTEMNTEMGNENWYHIGNNGSGYTRVITDADGNERFVTAEQDGTLALVDRQGGISYLNNDDLARGIEDGTLSDSGETPLFDYLDNQGEQQRQEEEQERIEQETADGMREVASLTQPGMRINVGSVENPIEGVVLQNANGMVVLQMPDGSTREYSYQDLSGFLGINLEPKTDEQIEQEESDAMLRQQAKREQANNHRGQQFERAGQQYTFVGVTKETGWQTGETKLPYEVHVKDANGQDSIIPMAETDFDALLQQLSAAQPATEETAAEETPVEQAPAESSVPVDFRGNPLPMRQNKVTGEQVVNETALWNNDPEAWARWNDTNPNQKVSSKERIEYTINELSKELDKDAKALKMAALKGIDADEMDVMEDNMGKKQERLSTLRNILVTYNAPAEAADTFAGDQRKAAAAQTIEEQQAGFPGIQQRWQAAPKFDGMPDEIRLPNGETVAGHYVLTDATAPTASHNPASGFTMSEGFPVDENGKTVNDRDYEQDKAAQQAVVDKAANYDQRALQTPVIVSSDGVVLSGNDRTMAGQIAAQNNTDAAYVDYLRKYPQKYGFTPEQVAQYQHPRVVFVPDGALPYNAATFSKFNAEEKKSQNKTEKAVKAGKTLSEKTLGELAGIVDRYEDINALYNDADGVDELLKSLLDGGVISQEQIPAMKDGELLSGAGMDLLESTLIGAALEEEAVRVAMMDKHIRKSIVSAISQILKGNTLKDYTLRSELTDAVTLLAKGKDLGEIKVGESAQSYVRQLHLFMDDVVAESTVQMLADVINDRRTSFLKKVLNLYTTEAVSAANGQMSLLTLDVPTKTAIINDTLQYLGYDTSRIYDTTARAAAQLAAAERAAEEPGQPESAEQDVAPVQGDEGSSVSTYDRDEVRARLEEGGIGDYNLADTMTDDEVAELLRLYEAFLPANDALGQAYTDLDKDLHSSDKKVKKAAQAKISALEQAQVDAFAPVNDFIQGLIEKYGLEEEFGMQESEEDVEEPAAEDVAEPAAEEPKPAKKKSSKKQKGGAKKGDINEPRIKGGASEKTIEATTYTQEEWEEFVYGYGGSMSKFHSKKTGETIQLCYVDDRHPVYGNHGVMFWSWADYNDYGNHIELNTTTDYIIKYLKANKFKYSEKDKPHKNKYGYWMNIHGVCTNPIRIELPSVSKGWAQTSEAALWQEDNGKWYIDGSASHGTGGGSIGFRGRWGKGFKTKAEAVRELIKGFEAFRKNHPGDNFQLKDCDNLIRTLKTKTLPQALMEEGVVESAPRTEITAGQLNEGVTGDLFAQAEAKPKRQSRKKAEQPAATEQPAAETTEEEEETRYTMEDEEGTPGNYHWPEERVCTNPTIVTAPGGERLGNVSKIALAEKDGNWYYTTYVVADGGKGSAWGSAIPSFKSNFVAYPSREDALRAAVDYLRFIIDEQAVKSQQKYGETYNDTKALIDTLVSSELPKAGEERRLTEADAIKAIGAALKTGNPARVVRTLESVQEVLSPELGDEVAAMLADFRSKLISKEAKDAFVAQAQAFYNRVTGVEEEVQEPAGDVIDNNVVVGGIPKYGSQNTIVTSDRYEELKKRMKEKLNRLNAGVDPELFSIGAEMAVYHIEAGARTFVDFSRRMINDLGDAIRPYLKAFYNGARYMPGMESINAEMDSAADVDAMDVNAIGTEEQAAENVAETPSNTDENISETARYFVSLAREQGVNLDVTDFRTFMTPEARQFFEKYAKDKGRIFHYPQLSFITFASECNVDIPAANIMRLPEFMDAEQRMADISRAAKDVTGSDTLVPSEETKKELIQWMLGKENGSYVGKGDHSGPVSRERKAFIIIGRPAGGKSSVFAKPLSIEHKARVIDSDEVKPKLEGYNGGYGANYVHAASAKIADEALLRAAAMGENLIIPRIGGPSIISEVALPLRAAGYTVQLLYNEVSPANSIMRAAARFAEHGRYLSIGYLDGIKDKPYNTYRNFVQKTIGESLNELSETKVQELRRRAESIYRLEGELSGAVRPAGERGGDSNLDGSVQGAVEQGAPVALRNLDNDAPLFEASVWKNNSVLFGQQPVTVWTSESGEPFPGTQSQQETEPIVRQVNTEGLLGAVTDMSQGRREEVRLSDFAEPVEEQTTQTDNTDEEQTDEQTAADTAAICSEAASVAEQASSVAETESPAEPARAAELITRIDDALEAVDDQLALLGYYKADTDGQFHESYGYMKSAEKKAVKDADKLAKKLAKDLGIEVGRKQLAKANIAPARGDITFRLPLNEGRELYVDISVAPADYVSGYGYSDDLVVRGILGGGRLAIMYRVENPAAKGDTHYETANAFEEYNVTYDKLLHDIRSTARKFLPEGAFTADIVNPLQVAKEQAEKNRKSAKKSVTSQENGDALLGGLFATLDNEAQTTAAAEQAAEQAPQALAKPTELNGYSIGQKVTYTDYSGNSQEATIYEFENGQPVLDTGMAPVIYGVAEWDNIKPLNNGPERTDDVRTEGAPADDSGQREGLSEDGGRVGGETGQESGRPDGGREEGRERDVHGQSRTLRPRYDDSVKRNTRNNRVAKGEVVYPKTVAARYRANIEAIRLLKDLQNTGKQATKAQMAVLRQYTGWGGLGTYFNNTYTPEHRELAALLNEEEMQAAALSINTAYYTPVEVIDSMWDVAKRLGFEGGNVLEGSAGIGNILASMPKNISERSEITAVELDNITGGILQQLYPDANVQIKGFEETDIPNNSVDLAITNVPFGDIQMYDAKEKDLTRKFGGKIHDFCIAKNIRKLAEGGIGIFISTRGTLDNNNKSLRQWIVNEGGSDVIGAFRLNNETFEGTGATSDIIVVRKRVNGKKSPNAIDIADTTITRREDYELNEREWNPKTRAYEIVKGKAAMEINSYYVEHPENMGGTMGFGFEHNDSYRPGSVALWPAEKIDQNKRLAKWAKQFSDMQAEEQAVRAAEETVVEDANATKEGQLITNSKGEICVSRSGKAIPIGVNAQKVKGYSKATVLADYDALKTAINAALDYQLKNDSDEGLKPLLDRLNKAYDNFKRRYDRLNRNTAISFLRNDVDFPSVAAVENFKESKDMNGKVSITTKKSNIFSGRVLGAKRIPTPKDVKDGIIVSMNQFGRIDVPFIADALNKGDDEVRQEIISSGLGFENPMTGNVEVVYEYLSGNVREKLEYAREHNTDGRYDRNVEALEKAVPAEIPAHLIEFSLGSDWIPTGLYTKYAMEKFGVNEEFEPVNMGGSWVIPENGWFNQHTEQNLAAGVHSESLRIDRYGHELMIAAMNNTPVVFSKTFKDIDGTSHTEYDKTASAAATNKIAEMKDDFKEWARGQMLQSTELAEQITKIYNDTFNAIVPKNITDIFIPEHFEGQASTLNNGKPLKLREHQAKAVIRATTEPVMLAHEVGSGKTFTLIASAMEMRRLGTAKKPMIVVQNATLGQFVSSAKEMYPNAKVLTISESDRTTDGRSAFYAKIKYNDWDMIIVPQSVFEMIPDSQERQNQFIQEKIEEKMFILAQAKEAKNSAAERKLKQELEDLQYELEFGEKPNKKGKGGKKDAKKEAEAKANAAARAKKQLDRRTDEVSDFDDMGIDALLIDEAHNYKHLGFSTAMQRGVKGVDATGSKRAAGVYLKTRAVFDKVGWKNVVFATGTPISNTAAEIWTFMKYLMPADVMRKNHIFYFDDFVRNFGNISQSLEFTTSGKFKENTRFSSYTNLPELMRIWLSVADIVLSREAKAEGDKKLEDELPKMEGGQARDIYLPQSASLVDIMNAVRAKLEWYEGLSGKEKKENSHIPLTMFGIAKMAAIDPRLVDRNAADEPNSKTNKAVEETLKALEDSKKFNGTAALFCDNFRRWDYTEDGKRVEGFNIFEEIQRKLINAGVPADQIVIIKSGMTTAAKEKIFAKVNAGEIRVIMGSTETLGTGVNIQERLFFEAHIDAPNRPMDYTQRVGRILRQGNLLKDWGIPARIVRFGVEDSLDVTAYQRLSTKSKFIDSVMNGKALINNSMENRVLEEEEEGIFDNPVAVLSGSQYAMLKSQAERDLRKLRNKKEQHRQDQIYIERKVKENESSIKVSQKLREEDEANLAKVRAAFPDGTVKNITIEGVKVKGAEQIAAAIKTKITDGLRETIDRRRKDRGFEKETVQYKMQFDDVPVTVFVDIIRKSEWEPKLRDFRISMSALPRYSAPSLGVTDAFVAGGVNGIKDIPDEFMKYVATGRRFETAIANLTNGIERLEADNKLMNERRGKPFEDEDKLKKQEELVKDYTDKMKAEMAEKEAKYAEIAKNATTTFSVDNIDVEDEAEGDEAVHNREAEVRAPRLNLDNPMEMTGAVAAVNRIANKLGLDVRFINDASNDNKGSYREGDSYVTINLANAESIDDAVETLLHEGVAHFGLRKLLGEDGMRDFINNLLSRASRSIRNRIEQKAADNGWSLEYAAEEYIAELAQRTNYHRPERSFWRDVVRMVRNIISFFTGRETNISDDTLREVLVASYSNLRNNAGRETLTQEEGEADETERRNPTNLRTAAAVDNVQEGLWDVQEDTGEFGDSEKVIHYSKVTDKAKIAELEAGEKSTGYRNVVQNADGTLGSPMAARLGRKGAKSVKTSPFTFNEWEQAEENPDMATENGKINLGKPDGLGSVDGVDYNPYIHIRPTLLNKQFTGAWKRPNLVYVETLYPTSELTSGYHAEKAAKSVGLHDWNGGQLILSRYDKPTRIVPWSDVADEWQKEFGESGVTFDIVPPGLLPVLVERGVNILPPKAAAGQPAIDAYNAWRNGASDTSRQAADIYDNYENQNGEDKPWISERELIDMIERRLPNNGETEVLFDMINQYRALEEEDIEEGRRDFAGGEMDDLFSDILDVLKSVADGNPVRNRIAYHGSIADFDRFDLSHAGAGEGFQSHGFGHYVALNKDTSVGYAWSNAFDKADRDGLIAGSIADVLRNDSFDDYDSMVERYDELHAKRIEEIKKEIADEREEKALDMSIIQSLEAELSLLEKDRPLREVFDGMRNLYTVEIPEDTGDNYLDEEKALNAVIRKKIADGLRSLPENAWKIGEDDSLLFHDLTAKQLADDMESRDYNGYEAYASLAHGFASKKDASEFLSGLGIVGIKYNGSSDGECAVIFNDDDVQIVGHDRWRMGGDYSPSPLSYKESMGAKRLAASETAAKCGIKIEFRPASQMKDSRNNPLAGRWINGKMYICLEHCRDNDDAVRTVLHEGVGHNGLRRLIGNENMRDFCLDMFGKLPTDERRRIADAAVNRYGGNVAEAVEEYLAERAEVMDFENENYERNIWDIVLDALRRVLAKVGINVPLSQRDVRWLMWQSYNANKQSVLDEAKRQVVANRLGFTLRQQADKVKTIQETRNRVAEDVLAPAARIYNKDVLNWMYRLRETWVDKDDSVQRLVNAIEKATGSKAKAFEDVRLALNHQSSKGLAAIEKFEREQYLPMKDAIKALMAEKGCDLKDVERYVMIKHALERNEVFAKRDAREYYQDIHDRAVAAINNLDRDNDEKDLLKAKEDAQLERHFNAIDAGTDAKYKELRAEDYGGLTAMYSDWDAFEPFSEGIESVEEYQARVLQSRHPRFTVFDDQGREIVDMAATEEAARKEVEEFEADHDKAIEELWKRINNATKATLKHQYDANMMSRDQYLRVRDMFKYYVPLRGFADNTAEDMYDYYTTSQRNDFTPPLLKAKGRKTEAESPFGYIGAMASSGIAADMKNETKLALYYFVSNRAKNDLVTISDVWYEKTGVDEQGRSVFTPVYPDYKEDLGSEQSKQAYEEWEKGMEEKAKSGLAFKGKKKLDLHNSVIHIDNSQKASHIIKFRVGGRDMMMYINGNPRAAQAINNELNVEMSTDYQKVFGRILRWISGINTSYNPEFWLSNAQRDALFALMSVNIKEDSEYNREFRKNFGTLLRRTLTPGAKNGAYSLKRKLDSGKLGDERLDRLYAEFVENGGVTGYTTLKNNEEWELELRKYTGEEKKAVQAVKTAFEAVQGFGEAIEQMTRFSAYVTSRELGKDIKQSVADAKELTVNFNRKGSGKAISFKEAERLRTKDGKKLNGVQKAFVVAASWLPVYGRRFIIFFNASVQGLNAMYNLFKKNPDKMGYWAAGYLALGVVQAVIHALVDDDDDYLDIPDYERRNNLLVGGNGVYLKWALPQESRVFYALGDMAVNHALGREPHKSIAGEFAASLSDIAPLNPSGGIAALAPAALTPIVEVALNRDYKGSKIFNDLRYLSDEERKRTPAYQRAYSGTGKVYIELSQFANWLSGGDYADAGWLNINPAAVEHILQGATGGAGTTLGKLYRGTVGQVLGEDFTVRNTPFLSRLLTVTDDRYRNAHTTELFDFYKAEAEHTKKLLKTYTRDGKDKKLDRLYENGAYDIMTIYESYRKPLQWYNDELKVTDDKKERKALMREQDALRKEMIKEISEIK